MGVMAGGWLSPDETRRVSHVGWGPGMLDNLHRKLRVMHLNVLGLPPH